ncbi:ComF family protein [Sporolactobacillus sp. CQH2019]|uniref:ComF family protein n=1 Tax=Sporolactobacillus sp. CQH2019 TaxID=3023512 RepID=UPI0023680C38|nr:ComF family protein [Sporolactobacillus sp. CQH2019]MDD9148046.1 ComF family protein [Sporolactobacillus sp. CQH2019]
MNRTRCLFCGGIRQDPLTVRTLLLASTDPGFCRKCRKSLEPIDLRRCCLSCGRDLRLVDVRFVSGSICSDCRYWEKSGRNGLFGRNRSLFTYNDGMKAMMTRFKFRGDALLAAGFKREFRSAYRKLKGSGRGIRRERLRAGERGAAKEKYQIVPIPLSQERLWERGFNQALVLAELLEEPLTHALIRQGSERKQSKKSRRERLSADKNPFLPDPEAAGSISGRKVLLIDDIYTTGATLRMAARALEAAGPLRIDSLTLVHG